MMMLLATTIFVLVLASRGRVGPFVWAGRPLGGPGGCGHAAEVAARPTPETILAERLAEGDISPEEYLERLSLISSR